MDCISDTPYHYDFNLIERGQKSQSITAATATFTKVAPLKVFILFQYSALESLPASNASHLFENPFQCPQHDQKPGSLQRILAPRIRFQPQNTLHPIKQWQTVPKPRKEDSATQLIPASVGHVFGGGSEGRVIEALFWKLYQLPCSNADSDTKDLTHRVLKPKHSKRSDDEFTWTNRPKNETHPGVALHVYWHLKEP